MLGRRVRQGDKLRLSPTYFPSISRTHLVIGGGGREGGGGNHINFVQVT